MNQESDSNQDAEVPRPPLRYRIIQGTMSPLMKLCGLSCRHFAQLAALRVDRALKPMESLRFRLHRIVCGVCQPLPMQFENLRKLTRCACQDDESTTQGGNEDLSPEAKQRIRAALEKEP